MNSNVSKRRTARFLWTVLFAVALALIPPVLYQSSLYGVFFPEDAAKEIATQFTDATRWIHAGAVAMVWLLNLIFFLVNEKKGDFGDKLAARTGLQNFLNILLILLSVAAVIGYRFAIDPTVWIGVYLPSSTTSKLRFWTPYIVVGASTFLLWLFCTRAAPATNCAVRAPIARWFDNRMKHAERSR